MKKRDLKRFKNIPTLKTERLVLRKIKESDFRDVFEYSSDPEVPKYLLWNPHVSLDHTKLYLKNISKLYKRCEFYDWAITYNGKMIGTVGYSSISLIEQWIEIGYVLNRRYWGLGIATEAVKKIIDYAICELKISEIRAVIMPENLASKRLLLKLGFIEFNFGSEMLIKEKYTKVSYYKLSTNGIFSENQ